MSEKTEKSRIPRKFRKSSGSEFGRVIRREVAHFYFALDTTGIKLGEIMAKALSVEIRLCHDSGNCLAALISACFSCRRKDFNGLA